MMERRTGLRFGEMSRLAVVLAVVAVLVLPLPATPSARGRYCPPLRDEHAEVIHLSARLGCGAVRRLALKTTESSLGYYKSRHWYCRWGQGGTRPIRVNGRVYYGGFCDSVPEFREASFLGRRLAG
jgi:hypothetical protein